MSKSIKKICIVVPNHWAAKMGGSQYQAGRLVNSLVKKSSYDVFCLSRSTNRQFKPKGYSIVNISSNCLIPSYRRICDIPKLISALGDVNPDIIYQRVGGAYTGAAAFYAKRSGTKMVWHIASENDVLPYRECRHRDGDVVWLEKRILEYGIRNSSHIVAQTHDQAQMLAANYNRDVVAVIPNFHPPPTEKIHKSNPIKIVWIANIKRLKQPELFLKLADDLVDEKEVRFIMIGAQSNDVSWQSLFRNALATLPNFEYLGQRSQEEVNAVLANAHLLVNTSRYEGFSNTFVQAWLRKVPVVSLCVNPDGIFDAGTLGLHSGSYEDLRFDVKELIKQPGKLEKMGNYAYEYAIEKHSDRNIASLINILLD